VVLQNWTSVCSSAINDPFNLPRSLKPAVFNEASGVSRSKTMPAQRKFLFTGTRCRDTSHTVDDCAPHREEIKTAD